MCFRCEHPRYHPIELVLDGLVWLVALSAVLAVYKLIGVHDLSWWIVTAPAIAPIGVAATFVVFVGVLMAIEEVGRRGDS